MLLNELEKYTDTQNNIGVCNIKTSEPSMCKRWALASFPFTLQTVVCTHIIDFKVKVLCNLLDGY